MGFQGWGFHLVGVLGNKSHQVISRIAPEVGGRHGDQAATNDKYVGQSRGTTSLLYSAPHAG